MVDILLKYILWYEFSDDLAAQSDFDKNLVAKKNWSSRSILILSML